MRRRRPTRARPAARLAACVALALALPARALVVDGDPAAALREPAPGSPVAWVARLGGTGGVYLGAGWVVTASHVGAQAISIDGTSYPPVAGSWKPLRGEGATGPDLGVFRVDPAPRLAPLEIARRAPALGEPLLLVAWGAGRGERLEWDGRVGFRWDPVYARRWGRNRVAATGLVVPDGQHSTRAFATLFSPGEPEEAQAAHGDSGGGAFVLRRGSWRLVGILFSVVSLPGQPPGTAVGGNATNLADLSVYREEIEGITGLTGQGEPAGR